MYPCRGPALGLLIAILAVPSIASGQQPKDDRFTQAADNYLSTILINDDEAAQRQAYEQALEALRPGFTEAADNPKIWFLAGQAHAGLSHFLAADSAFDKAVEMWPEYEREADAYREQGWLKGFNAGVTLMDQDQFAEAAATLEAAHVLYPKRPEGALNMANLFASPQLDQLDKAEWAYQEAINAVNGPLFERIDSASQVEWKRYERIARENLAQVRGQKGVKAFGESNYDEAIAAFQSALEINPHSRDFIYNIVQARYAKARDLEAARDTSIAPGQAPQDPQLIQTYTAMEPEIQKVLEYDPNNQNVVLFQARAYRRLGELQGNPEEAQQKAVALLTKATETPFFLQSIYVAPGDGTAGIEGTFYNQNAEEGQSFTVRFTILGYDGSELASQDVTVQAPAKEQTKPFQATVPGVARSIAGWKYVVVN